MATTVTSKGQVTIPKPVRDRLGIKPGNAWNSRWPPTAVSFW
jgi:bifunctional DNA-binding transcriptional regulator/antitoxin component of YhaV-PrlF toxin-antitoxin module